MSSDSEISDTEEVAGRTPLVSTNEDGTQQLNAPYFEYQPLQGEEDEIRMLLLYPSLGDDVNAANDHVRCDLEITPLSAAPPFIAVQNARGYRIFESAIEVNEHGLIISTSLERFLRNYRAQIIKPTLMWIRHICVIQWDETEKNRYWTREWSNRMYDMATETIDMHSFNSRLIEDGKIERVIDGRFRTWTKEWHGLPEEVVLPKVFPIWLGTKLVDESSPDAYKYVPLDPVADEIRVMILMPSGDPEKPVVMHAAHCPIKCDVTYTALSYQWGLDTSESEIVLNGQRKSIRATLEQTLRAIRQPDNMMPIWIDAVSINQGDVSERNRQIPRMGTIYDNAASVTAYVGAQSEDSDLAIELIKKLQEPMMRINDRREWHFGPWTFENGRAQYGENSIPPERLAVMAAALYKFLTRPYFRRAWVLQELAAASNPVIVVGSNWDTGFRRLDMAAYNFLSMLHYDPRLAGQIESADPSIGELDVSQLAFPRKLFYFRHLLSNAQSHDGLGFQFVQIPKISPGFLETLILARDFECADPRDNIYALWNLARDKAGLDFRVDYSKPFEQIYQNFARAWINQHGSLDILGAIEYTSQSAEFYSKTPSWCPDWSNKAQASCLVRKEVIPTILMFAIKALDGALYSADGRLHRDDVSTPLFHFDEESNALHCTALILDQIRHILPNPPEPPHEWLIPPCDPHSYHKFQHWTKEIDTYFQEQKIETYDDPLQAAVAMFHGDVPSTWPPRDQNPANCDDSEPLEQYVALPNLARHFDQYAGSYDRTTAWNVVKTVLRGRRPFVSKDGHMGLMPEYLQDDGAKAGPLHLAILATCSVPVILREREDGSYQLVGTAFVQGWMEGEVLSTMFGVESLKELWESLVEAEKVRIT